MSSFKLKTYNEQYLLNKHKKILSSYIYFQGRRIRTQLEFTTKAFADSNLQLKSDFNQTLVNDFDSDIESIDFSNSHNSSEHINSWVSQSTHGRITKLFTPSKFSSLFLLLCN